MSTRTQTVLLGFLIICFLGLVLPEGERRIPVVGASYKDWNPRSFWYHPWGRSGVHKGIDIFAKEGTPVIAATGGLVVYSGTIDMGGNVVLILGSKWRFFYYAHLQSIAAQAGQWRHSGEAVGMVGSTGNAAGKPPHLHFAIHSLIPLVNKFDIRLQQPFQRLFYVNPDVYLKSDNLS
jgi:peptidoglycan LD-endopeptidase LytH